MDVGYFITGSGARMSGGTRPRSWARSPTPAFGFRDGRVQTERGAKRVRSFQVGSKKRAGVSVGSSEHFALPRRGAAAARGERLPRLVRPGLARDAGDVGLHVGREKVPGVDEALERRGRALRPGLHRRPGRRGALEVRLAHRRRSPTTPPAAQLSEVHLTGVDGYTFTGRMLAWGAERAAAGGAQGTGALGPVDGFGLDELVEGCAEAGIAEEGGPAPGAQPGAASPPTRLTRRH